MSSIDGKKNLASTAKLKQELGVYESAVKNASDSIYGILISHLYVEHLLDRCISCKLVSIKEITGKNGYSFSDKLKLIDAFGEFEGQLIDSLKKLNSIRNNCAHKFGHTISEKDVEGLGKTLGKDYRKILKKYPCAEVFGIAPITWSICARVLSYVAIAEGWK
ncbi:hypothetical protein ONV78_28115 [Hahella sp. CR1]|uniref:hypothetical protein n=1 Tax=Hahella sp. CR1 TaxID=2992807 RepID=UPI00244203C9|nr:hypothetical protein [Hahella sp. CR1]MDG9671634.1 hypothetical protein [Hahella sp. CR1]